MGRTVAVEIESPAGRQPVRRLPVALLVLAAGGAALLMSLWPMSLGALPAVSRVEATGPFSIEYTVTPQRFDDTPVVPTLNRLDFTSIRDWRLTVLEGGEGTGYYERMTPDGTMIAGYPEWNQPQVLSTPGSETSRGVLPGWYLIPRKLPPPGSPSLLTAADDPELLDLAADLGRDPGRLVEFVVGEEGSVYDLYLGIPLLIRYRTDVDGTAVFRVTAVLDPVTRP